MRASLPLGLCWVVLAGGALEERIDLMWNPSRTVPARDAFVAVARGLRWSAPVATRSATRVDERGTAVGAREAALTVGDHRASAAGHGAGATDAALIDEALTALLAARRAAEVDAAYVAYDTHPPDEPDAWGDLASFRSAAGAS